MNNMSVSKTIYNTIKKNVSTTYLFSGGSIMSLINHFNKNDKLKYYVPSSEQSCCFISSGHNKSLNKLDSVVITTSGPGVTNCLTGLCDSYSDRIPFLLITGDVSTKAMGTRAFQECPSIELTKSITHWNYNLVDPAEAEDVMKYAFYLTKNNKVVHINIPKDVLSANLDLNNKSKFTNLYNLNKPTKLFKNNIQSIADIINKSSKPILYIGKGCIENSDLIRKLSKLANIPVTTTLHGLGIVDESDELSLKMLGMHGSERANYSIQLSDCIICIGARFDDRTTGNINKYAPNAKNIIHVNTDPNCFGKVIKNTINIHANAKDYLKELLPLIKENKNKEWVNELNKYSINFPYNDLLKSHNAFYDVKQQNILELLNNALDNKNLKENLFITTGVGNHQMFSAQLLTHKYPNRFITSGSLGSMGYGNCAAIGVKIANPSKMVICIDGDQSFNMLNDLKCIMNYNIPIKIVIMNDNKQSMVNVWEKLFFNNNIVATESINPNYQLLAESYNIKCITIDYLLNVNNIIKAINDFIDYDFNKPIILNCIIKSDYCLPLVPPGNGLDEMVTYKNINKYIIDKSSAPS
jgi:acetolactate synthase-1/2/3 large subunit